MNESKTAATRYYSPQQLEHWGDIDKLCDECNVDSLPILDQKTPEEIQTELEELAGPPEKDSQTGSVVNPQALANLATESLTELTIRNCYKLTRQQMVEAVRVLKSSGTLILSIVAPKQPVGRTRKINKRQSP